jgi:hypothetical protein
MSFFFWAECGVAFLLLIGMVLIVIYHGIGFVEERVKTVKRVGQMWCVGAAVLSFMILPAGYGVLVWLSTLTANLAWFSVLSREYPSFSKPSIDLIVGIVAVLLSHVAWIYAFMKTRVGAIVSLAYYIGIVWAVPLIVLIVIIVTDAKGARTENGSPSVWIVFFGRIISFVRKLARGAKGE